MTRQTITRRSAIKRLATISGAAISAPYIWTRASAAEQITVAHPGGPYEKAHDEAFLEPFSKATGIQAVSVARRAAPAAQVKAMVETKTYQWDAVYLNFSEVFLLAGEGLLEKIDTTSPDYAELPANMKNEYVSATDANAVVMTYNTQKFGSNPPQSWADFWNVQKFSGRRSLGKRGYDTAEEALMADGVTPGPKVYETLAAPGGWERVFKKLDEIKPHINRWWDQPAQSSQFVKSTEVDLIAIYNARAQLAIDEGAPFALVWNQGLYDIGGYVIAKGNPKADAVRKFIAFTAIAKQQAITTNNLKYGPSNPGAYKYIDKKTAAVLPTYPENLSKMMQIDAKFWGKEKQKANEKMNEWLTR